jgi:uncharacterized repeat protein (TIGR03803 family)
MLQSRFALRAICFTFALSAAALAFPSGNVIAQVTPSHFYGVLHAFKGPPDAAYGWAGMVLAKDGNLYGTTWAGGDHANCKGGLGAGCGALFRLDSSGKETVIYNFVGTPGPIHLRGPLLPAGDGAFYGFTEKGGTAHICYQGGGNGCGTAFKLTKDGKLKVLYNFGSQGGWSDAIWPDGGPIRDESGNLYGTSSAGGTNQNGTIFEIGNDGTERVLYRFTDGADGGGPASSLVRDSVGNLYGVTAHGGGACGCGTVFMLDPNGVLTVLYTFQGGTDGGNPVAGLIRDRAGNLYGTAALFGDSACDNGYGCGVVFELAPDGTETVLHTFFSSPDGALPVSQLEKDAQGNLYGTTWLGGNSTCANGIGCGVVFEVTKDGRERVLHRFGGKDGMYPWGRVSFDASGNLVGETQQGGRLGLCPNGCGLIYTLTP